MTPAKTIDLNLVDSTVDTDDMKPGDAMIFSNRDGSEGLIICCPGCGKTSTSSTGNHKYNAATKSMTPSIVHSILLGGCGWHGTLTNGKFTGA